MIRGLFLTACIILSAQQLFPATIAVSYFDNNSEIAKYNSLSKGIADMLITDLSKIEGITIVEREKLESLLNEIKLGQTKYFDPTTAQKLGKGLGAETILTGAFFIMDNTIRIDARLIDVETSQILMAEQVTGASGNFFQLHSELVGKLSKSLKLPKQQVSMIQAGYKPVHIDAVVAYSDAIDASDQGLGKDAVDILEQTVEKYPEFIQAKSKLDGLKEWLAQMEKKREEMISAEIDRILKELSVKDPEVNMKINSHWSTLVSSMNYSQILVFNEHLISLGLDLKSKMFGEASPLTFGEMLTYYNCLAYAQLNMHNELIDHGKEFIEKYPTSMYYLGVKTWLEKSIDELQQRSEGEKLAEKKMKEEQLEIYLNYLDDFDIYYVKKFISEEQIIRFERLCRKEVIEYLKSVDESPEDIDASDLEDIFDVAKEYDLTDLMQELVEVAFHLYSGTDEEEEAYSLEEEYNKYTDDKYDLEEKQLEFREKIKCKESVADYGSLIQFGFNMRRAEMYDELKDICYQYLEYSKGMEPDDVGRYVSSAWDNLLSIYEVKGNIEEYEKNLEKCKSDEIFRIYTGDKYEREIKEYEKELRELKKDKRSYENDFLNYPLELELNLRYANIYHEYHQFLDEIKILSKILKSYSLNEQALANVYYSLVMAYREYGMYEEARTIYNLMQTKLPSHEYTTMLSSIVNVMPK